MRVGLMAENPIETAVLASGVVPVPMLEAYAPVYARAIVIATKLGVFEALREVVGRQMRLPRPVAPIRAPPRSS